MSYLATVDPEDLTPKQMRKILNSFRMESAMRHKRKKNRDMEEDEDEDEDEDKENDDLVDLHREQTGDDNSPPVTKDDLPKGVTKPEDEEEEEEEEEPKKKKKKKNNG